MYNKVHTYIHTYTRHISVHRTGKEQRNEQEKEIRRLGIQTYRHRGIDGQRERQTDQKTDR